MEVLYIYLQDGYFWELGRIEKFLTCTSYRPCERFALGQPQA